METFTNIGTKNIWEYLTLPSKSKEKHQLLNLPLINSYVEIMTFLRK